MSDTATHSRGGDFATSRRGGLSIDDLSFASEKLLAGVSRQAVANMLHCPMSSLEGLDSSPRRNTVALPPPEPRWPRRPPPIEPDMVLSLWKGLIKRPPTAVTLDSLKWAVARDYGVTVEDLEGQGRTRSITIPRQDLMWRAVQAKKWSLPQIGRSIGGRDHTTILHGARAHQARLDAQEQAKAA